MNPQCDALFQRPKTNVGPDDDVWNANQSIGRNKLGSFMSEKAKLSKIYTNNCLRATVVTAVAITGIDGSDIIKVTGHQSD